MYLHIISSLYFFLGVIFLPVMSGPHVTCHHRRLPFLTIGNQLSPITCQPVNAAPTHGGSLGSLLCVAGESYVLPMRMYHLPAKQRCELFNQIYIFTKNV